MSGVQFTSTCSLVDAYLVLYDMINDDDEELRDIAAESTTQVLANDKSVIPRLPLASSIELAEFLATNFRSSERVFEGSLRRLLGQNRGDEIFVPVSRSLANLRRGATALFEEEKQNLYIDDVREVQTWSEILTQLSSTQSGLSLSFFFWVTEGLDALTSVMREEETDGVLGWTSKSEIYITGIRVISGAGVLLCRNDFGADGFDVSLIRSKLEALLEVGKKTELHERWVFWMQRALP